MATGCHILRLKCTKFNFGWVFAPDPTWRGYSAPPDPLARFQVSFQAEGERRNGRARGNKSPEWFLPCDAMRCTVSVIVILSACPSVCPFVCLSVTYVDCVHMVRHTIMISSPYGSPIILWYQSKARIRLPISDQ